MYADLEEKAGRVRPGPTRPRPPLQGTDEADDSGPPAGKGPRAWTAGTGKGHDWSKGQPRVREVVLDDFIATRAPPLPKRDIKVVIAERPFERRLLRTAPRTPYRRRVGEVKTTLDWRARKLLLLETEFLLQYGDLASTVIYDGAAPGYHLPLLSRLFPKHDFLLMDKRTHTVRCDEQRRLKIIHGPLTHAMAESLRQKHAATGLLYISNIKAGDWDSRGGKDDRWTHEEMAKQRAFYEILKPKKALLRFRLPYEEGVTEYLDGAVLLCPYGSQTSTECRLVPEEGAPPRQYNHKTMEEQMFHFNTFTRVHTFPEYAPQHKDHARHIMSVEACGFDWRYDVTAEVSILCEYARKNGDTYFREKAGREAAAAARALRIGAAATLKEQRAKAKGKKGKAVAKKAVKRKRAAADAAPAADAPQGTVRPAAAAEAAAAGTPATTAPAAAAGAATAAAAAPAAGAEQAAPPAAGAAAAATEADGTGQQPATARDQDSLPALVARYSEEISAVLSRAEGRSDTLASRPLTFLHEKRTAQNPFNQNIRGEVLGPNSSLIPAPAAAASPPAAPVEPPAKRPRPAAGSAAALLSDLGVEVSDESSSDPGIDEESADGGNKPAPPPAAAPAPVFRYPRRSAVDDYMLDIERQRQQEEMRREEEERRRREARFEQERRRQAAAAAAKRAAQQPRSKSRSSRSGTPSPRGGSLAGRQRFRRSRSASSDAAGGKDWRFGRQFAP